MDEYFLLQLKLVSRQIESFGLPAALGYILGGILFGLASLFLFENVPFVGGGIYLGIALYYIHLLSERKRNEFLKLNLLEKKYRKIRIAENIFLCLPFTLFLIIRQQWIYAGALLLIAPIFSFFSFSPTTKWNLPTPFSKRPFEFPEGFRKTFPFIGLAYFFAVMGIISQNFGFGVFAMLIIGMCCLSFYYQPEQWLFVWIHNQSAKVFLWKKIGIGLWYLFVLMSPILIALFVFFGAYSIHILAIHLFLSFNLIGIILARYAAFPNKINTSQEFLLLFSLTFPPMLLAFLPFLYLRSINRLKKILI